MWLCSCARARSPRRPLWLVGNRRRLSRGAARRSIARTPLTEFARRSLRWAPSGARLLESAWFEGATLDQLAGRAAISADEAAQLLTDALEQFADVIESRS